MSFIEDNLLQNEKIVHKSHRHWIVFVFPFFFLIVGLAFLLPLLNFPIIDVIPLQLSSFLDYDIMYKSFKIVIFIPLFFALISISNAMINYFMTEIAITNLRILIKIGLIKRISTEIPLRNIATIRIIQGFWGRFWGYGTVEVCDVGNVCLPFRRIESPIVFRSNIQKEINEQSLKKPVRQVKVIEE